MGQIVIKKRYIVKMYISIWVYSADVVAVRFFPGDNLTI